MPAGYTPAAAAGAVGQTQRHAGAIAAGKADVPGEHRRHGSGDAVPGGAGALYFGLDLSTPRDADGNPTRVPGELVDPETNIRILVLHVVGAKGLIAADSNGTSDAFAVLQIEGAISAKPFKTQVKKATLDPKWDQTFRIPVRGRVGQLKLQVFDYDVMSANDFLGFAKTSLHTLQPGAPVREEWLKLKGSTDMGPAQGAVHIKVSMETHDGDPSALGESRKVQFQNKFGRSATFTNAGKDLEGVTSLDDVDLGFYFNIEPPLDARKLAARKLEEEQQSKLLARKLENSRQQKEREMQERRNRPPWKDRAWEKWNAAGDKAQNMFDFAMELAAKTQDMYRETTEFLVVDKNSLALKAAGVSKVKTWHEAMGWSFATLLFLTLFVASLYIWVRDFAKPLATYLPAECLAISSKQTESPRGFGLTPLMRGEVLVHVFRSTMPECCCPDMDGKERCAEWQTVSYDAVNREHSSGSKEDFIRRHGHPGSFYPCWHSPDKQWVILSRDWNVEFLWVPILALLSMCACTYWTFKKIMEHRALVRHYKRIHEIVHTPTGLLPEQAWIYEDADFHPHPKQRFVYMQIETAEEEERLRSSLLYGQAHPESEVVHSEVEDKEGASSDEEPQAVTFHIDDLLKHHEQLEEEEDNYPPEGEINLREWYNISSPIKGTLYRANLLLEEQRKVQAALALWYTFVVFENGGERSVAEIRLKAGAHRANWADMKARLVAKLGTNGLLGVSRGASWEHKTFCLQYIDPHQKALPNKKPKAADGPDDMDAEEAQALEKGEGGEEEEEEEEEDAQMGRVMLIRNEREWQQCWEVALKEDDNELEVDIVELTPEDFLHDLPETPPPVHASNVAHGDLVTAFVGPDLGPEDKSDGTNPVQGDTEEITGGWTDDEQDAGDDGPGKSPDVELTNRHVLRHADMGWEPSAESRPGSRLASANADPGSDRSARAGVARGANRAWVEGMGGSTSGTSSRHSVAHSSSVGTEQARQELLDLDNDVGEMVGNVYDAVIGGFSSRSTSRPPSNGRGSGGGGSTTSSRPPSGSGSARTRARWTGAAKNEHNDAGEMREALGDGTGDGAIRHAA